MATVWLNDAFVDESTASLSIRDTGVLYAAGVFTTMRAGRGVVFRIDKHFARLRESCQALSIALNYSNADLTAAVRDTLAANDLQDARLRLTVTAGTGGQKPNCFLTATELVQYPSELYERGLTVALLDEQKLNPFDIQAGHKTLNYLSRMAALRWARQREAGEALWFNIHNYLQSGSISNIFIVSANRLITPPTQAEINADAILRDQLPYARSNVLPGITRGAILESAQAMGLPIELSAINVEQLLDADEVFLTNSIMNVMPVARIERSIVGQDKPGPITMQLAEALGKMQHDDSVPGN